MIQMTANILANEPLNQDCWRMTLDAQQIASEIKPGQFVHVKLSGGKGPLFRRPLSVFRRIERNGNMLGIEIVYKVVGLGTKLMAELRGGDSLDVLGPQGHGFEWNRERPTQVVLAGGTGAACLFMLAEELSQAGLPLTILLGGQSKGAVLLEREFAVLKGQVMVSTDDGSYGYHGLVTQMLENALETGKLSSDCAIYASGPEPMLKSLASICQKLSIPAQVSMERHMMCGIGACLGCVCKVNPHRVSQHRDLDCSHIQFVADREFGYALVCKDGPVFDINEVVFDE